MLTHALHQLGCTLHECRRSMLNKFNLHFIFNLVSESTRQALGLICMSECIKQVNLWYMSRFSEFYVQREMHLNRHGLLHTIPTCPMDESRRKKYFSKKPLLFYGLPKQLFFGTKWPMSRFSEFNVQTRTHQKPHKLLQTIPTHPMDESRTKNISSHRPLLFQGFYIRPVFAEFESIWVKILHFWGLDITYPSWWKDFAAGGGCR